MIPAFLMPYLVNRYTVGGIVGLGLIAGAYMKGYWNARERCQDNALKAQIAAMKRDMEAWKAADYMERVLQEDLEAERRQLQQKVSEYEAELATRPTDNRCILDKRDVDGLRGNRKR